MSVYTAVRWDDSDEAPDVHLYEKMQDAVDWLLYPWREDMEDTDPLLLQRLEEALLAGKTIDMAHEADVGSTEHLMILSLTVFK